MKFKIEVLQKAAKAGSKEVAKTFSKLSKSKVKVPVSKVKIIPLKKSLNQIKTPKNHSIVVCGQLLSGIPGASMLIMTREHALTLVDLLNHQSVGTTGILKDIDRSAIKETFNILSNSYMAALAKNANIDIGLGVPSLITSERLNEIAKNLIEKNGRKDDKGIIFEADMIITEYKIVTKLYIILNEKLIKINKD